MYTFLILPHLITFSIIVGLHAKLPQITQETINTFILSGIIIRR